MNQAESHEKQDVFFTKWIRGIGTINIIGGILGLLVAIGLIAADKAGLANEAWAEMPANQVAFLRAILPVFAVYFVCGLFLGFGLRRLAPWARPAGVVYYLVTLGLSIRQGDWFWAAFACLFLYFLIHPAGGRQFKKVA